jgi:hypothetical protein
MYQAAIAQMTKELGQLLQWIDAAVGFAQTKKFDPELFLGFRLAPDQYEFRRQVQTVCDIAKLAFALPTGKQPPSHADTEQSLDELKARVRTVLAYLEGSSARDFEGADTRLVTRPNWEGKVMTGAEYFVQASIPNFFFHLTHCYAILRHTGVPLGKRDFLGPMPLRER